jgi:ribosomal protein L44E
MQKKDKMIKKIDLTQTCTELFPFWKRIQGEAIFKPLVQHKIALSTSGELLPEPGRKKKPTLCVQLHFKLTN